MTENQRYLNEAQNRVKEFETEREPERLRESSMALENIVLAQEHDPRIRAELRSNSLSAWLHLLGIVDRFLDPNFKVEDKPESLVQPPSIPGGVVLRPGADPALIPDPKARAQYERAIAANRANADRYGLQIDLLRLNEGLSQRAEAFIRSSYTSAKRDQEELSNSIGEIIKDQKRKARLLELLQARPRN
jgi:hypothetical protein